MFDVRDLQIETFEEKIPEFCQFLQQCKKSRQAK